jgi:hypothetical protein
MQVLAVAEPLARGRHSSTAACALHPDTVLPEAPPAALPALDAARGIARCSAAELPRARFRREFWKADRPVIIAGRPLLSTYCPW